ncbi:MAG TPA: AraC family transcriptional regulator [Dehalococcoidia bacterium]|nr:AraC family transcriptional regulator [Dehalococcoidia bacterium]
MARAIRTFAQTNGDHTTAIPALTLHRRAAPTEPLHCIYHVGLGVVAQGGKQVILGSESLSYMPGQSMVTTIDLPVVSHVTHATSREPFLGMMLRLDARAILQLATEMDAPRRQRDAVYRTVSIETLGADLLDALLRLVKLLEQPDLVPHLAPLIQQEITVRLLIGPHGPHLRHIVTVGSPSQQIATAVAWLKQNFVEAFRVDDLADRAHMSPSTFRQHFRSITGVSPLQYQKQLRLQEARQLMLNENHDAGSAAGQVGYESPSQFSREYSRLFGAPPQRDVSRMRLAQASAGADG